MPQTILYGSLIQSGSIPTTALGGGVVSSSAQLPSGLLSSSAQLPAGLVSSSAQINLTQTFGTASQAVTASYATNYAVGKAIAFSLIF